jgi:pimeloyl-ACP methyl ester carboxylesterase
VTAALRRDAAPWSRSNTRTTVCRHPRAAAVPARPRTAGLGALVVHAGGTITIDITPGALARPIPSTAFVPHSDSSSPSLGTVVTNPGGPGQSTIASASLYLQGAPKLLVHRDLLLIDPRGTGGSGALTCPSLGGAIRPTSKRSRSCAGPTWVHAPAATDPLTSLTTSTPSERRSASTSSTFGGDSYGTFLMQVYAARHSQHVRSVVLDGAFPIDSDPWGRDVLRGTRRVVRLACSPVLHWSGARL